MNSSKFKQIDDMANMTFLNEARILDNLCQHYTHTRIYDLKGSQPCPTIPSILAHPKNSFLEESLEDQIIQVNPVLDLDNAKTMGKNILVNLSEFTVVAQASWLGLTPRAKLLLVPNPNHYHWVHQGVITADNMDDGVAFDVLGSSPEEKICVYKLTRGIMHLGAMKFKQKPREECDTVTGWLEKKEDPLNETMVGLLQKSSMLLLWVLLEEEKAAAGGNKRQERGSSFVTASTFYRISNNPCLCTYTAINAFVFQQQLRAAGLADDHFAQHFIHCIVPNELKPSGLGLMAIQRNVQKFLQLLFWGGMNTGFLPLHWEQENLVDAEECLAQIKSKMDLLSQIMGMKELRNARELMLEELSDLKCDFEGLETISAKTEKEKQAEHRVQTLASDLSAQNDSGTEFQKEKRALEEVHQLEDKEQEKKIQGKVEKAHHKAESDLKMTTDNLSEMKRAKLGRGCKEVSIVAEFPRARIYIEKLEEDLEAERAIRTQVEKQGRSPGKSWCCNSCSVKLEMDKQVTKAEKDALSASMESLQKSKLDSDAHVHELEDNLSEANAQSAKVEKSQAEINAIRLQTESSQLSWEHDEVQSRLNQIVHMKISLPLQADDFKRQLDGESKSCTAAAGSMANTKHDLDPMEELEEEEESEAELHCLVSKLNTEVIIWRKYNTDATERTKKLEETKTKLAVRLQRAEKTAESVQAWVANMEKTKQRLQNEVEGLTVDLEKAKAACAALKKQRAFDRMLAEWQQKCKELQVEVPRRMYMTENFELKTAYEESLEHLEAMKKDNKALQEEIKDLINQLGEGGKSIHELQKKDWSEEDELQVALEEAESSLERLKWRAEPLRLKKMDVDLTSMEMHLDHATRNSELVGTLNKLQQHVKDLRIQVDEGACWRQEELQEQDVPPLPAPASRRAQRALEPDLQHTTNTHEETISEYAADERAKQAAADDGYVHLEKIKENYIAIKDLEVKILYKGLLFSSPFFAATSSPQEVSQSLVKYRKTIQEMDDAKEREGMAESALNTLHTRHGVSASKGLAFGEIIQVPKPSSSV
ncbi:LOW QUALITY PROTEIN: uncharacterized protein MYH16 [Aegotheles albertisi]